jgi:hypothetical protein
MRQQTRDVPSTRLPMLAKVSVPPGRQAGARAPGGACTVRAEDESRPGSGRSRGCLSFQQGHRTRAESAAGPGPEALGRRLPGVLRISHSL